MKIMSSTVPDHSLNITHMALKDVLDYLSQVYGLFTENPASCHLITPVMVQLACVYEVSTKGMTFGTCQLQKHHAVLVYHKMCLKTAISAQNQFYCKTCQSIKLGFEIMFIKHSRSIIKPLKKNFATSILLKQF